MRRICLFIFLVDWRTFPTTETGRKRVVSQTKEALNDYRLQMQVIGYNASPHRNGNTAWTVSQILEGAKESGASAEIWHAGDLDIHPCRGCLGCVKSDKCSIDDDMQKIYGALKYADGLVLGAPIYMGQMSAQAKIFTTNWVRAKGC